MALQVGMLRSDVYLAMGQPDSARTVLQQLIAQFPDNSMVQRVVGEAGAKLP
jgi:predicted Zn-dependent protease